MDLETASDSAIPRQSLTSAVADKLRDQIIRSELPEGAQPRQDAIATQHQVSRIPVRDALRQLDAEGLIAIVPNRGAVVPALSPDDIEELFLIRALLEPEVLKLSIPHLLQEDFSEAEAVLRKYVSELCSTPCPGNLDLLSVKHRKLGRIGSLSSRTARRRSFATSHASIRRTLVPGI
jgi:DNA-binding GntR family transcriptional regulator